MKSFGHINMQQNEIQEMAIAVEANFPAVPVPGRIVFKDRTLYMCVAIETGTAIWIPLTREIESYEHVQSVANTTWTIKHNLNTSLPSVQVYGIDNKAIFPGDIEIIDNHTVEITLGVAATGRAIVLIGSIAGVPRIPIYAYEHYQTELSDAWVINHNLGYHPIIRVFSGNQEINPASITHNSNFQATINFSSPQVGTARLL